VHDAFLYLKELFSLSLFSKVDVFPVEIVVLIVLFVVVEWLQRDKQHALEFDNIRIPKFFRYSIYYTILIVILLFSGQQQEFIYFQF